jgi:hypothetical protein
MAIDGEKDDSYERGMERSFNPLTDEKAVDEYIEYQHKRDALFNPELDLSGEKRNKHNGLKALAKRAYKKVKEGFEAVIQAILLGEHLERLEAEQHEQSIKKPEHATHASKFQKMNDGPHPHVDAVLHEHGHSHDRERSR